MDGIKLLDVVALLQDLPEQGLKRGEVGTVVEIFEATLSRRQAFLIEFNDRNGVGYAIAPLHIEQIIPLYYREAA